MCKMWRSVIVLSPNTPQTSINKQYFSRKKEDLVKPQTAKRLSLQKSIWKRMKPTQRLLKYVIVTTIVIAIHYHCHYHCHTNPTTDSHLRLHL